MIDSDTPVGLTRTGCLELLGTRTLGRIIFTASAMPAVEPVVYAVFGDEVVFRVRDRAALSTATEDAVVGFQVDDIDPLSRSGWSVVGVGQAYTVSATDPRALPRGGAGSHTVALPMQQLTGQRLQLGPSGIGSS